MVISTEDRVCVGAIAGVRGLKGEVRIKSFTADPDNIASYGPVTSEDGNKTFRLIVKSRTKGLLIARLNGIDDRTSAEKLKGERLYVLRSALPKPEVGEFYQADLVGLTAETKSGEELGTIEAVHNFGASDIIEITSNNKNHEETIMIPFTNELVPEVDIKGGRIVINPPSYVDAAGPSKEDKC
jgi:16S rRNA processing protein RimM